MKSKSEIKCLYFWVVVSINPFFFNLAGEVFKMYSYYLSCFKFDAAIYLVVYTYKYFFRFSPQNLTFLSSGIFWEMHIHC